MAASPIDKHEELFLFSLLKDLKLRARAWCCEVEVAWEKQKGFSQRCHQGCCGQAESPKGLSDVVVTLGIKERSLASFRGWASGRLGEVVTLGLAP